MSFVATIEDAENKAFFCKVVTTLNQFSNSEEIKITISNKNLKLSVFNRLRTSYGEVIIEKDFFGTFEFNSDGFYDEGLNVGNERDEDDDEDTGISYSFLVRSRILGMLFKNDPGVDSYKLSISVEDGYENQLKIDIRNTNLIRKEYNPFYIPFKDEVLHISKEYKAALANLIQKQYRGKNTEDNTDEGEVINYLMVSNTILKNVLDNMAANTEDFKIEINSKKFSVTGYTKKINNKEENLLKQAMAMNVTFKTDELTDFKLFNDGTNQDKRIIFRLKDFKNFLNLGQSNEIIEIWFKSAGDPILFEMSRYNCKIQFIQITDSDDRVHDNTSTKVTKLFKNDININKTKPTNKKSKAKVQKDHLFVRDEDNERENVEEDDDRNGIDITVEEKQGRSEREETVTPESYEDDEPIVGWNVDHDNDSYDPKSNSKITIVNEMKKAYLHEINNSKRQKVNSTQEELGPTQNIVKTKGLFD